MNEIISKDSVICRTTLSIRSTSQSGGLVQLLAEEARTRDEKGNWVTSTTHKKQIVRFFGSDGPVELSGIVAEEDTVFSKSAHFEVVCLCEVSTVGLPAFEAGRKGRVLMAVSLVGVLEVLDRSGKREWAPRIVSAVSPGKTMDAEGKIK